MMSLKILSAQRKFEFSLLSLQSSICVGGLGNEMGCNIIHRKDKYSLLVTLAFALSLNTTSLRMSDCISCPHFL